MRPALVAALLMLSCRKPAPPAHHDAAPARPAPADASRAPVADASPADAAPAEPPRVLPRFTPPPGMPRPDGGTRRTVAARRAPVNAEDPWALAASPRGALWVRAVNREGQRVSEIVATVIGRDGQPVGEPKLVRRTTGPIRDVTVDAQGEHVWIAWHAVRSPEEGAREEHIVAGIHGNADLTEVGSPVTVTNFSYQPQPDAPYTWSGPMARVFVRDDGGALLVSTGPRAVCVHGEDEEHSERVPCEGWNVSRLELDGSKRVRGESLLCPVGLPQAFVRVPRGIAYLVQDDHIGTKFVAYTEAFGAQAPDALPDDFSLWHYADAAMAYGDGALALRAHYTETETSDAPAADGVMVRGGASPTPALQDAYRMPVMPGIRRSPLRCVDGHPVVRVGWARGPAAGVAFDPTHAGTSLDLAAWADLRNLPLPDGAENPPDDVVWAGEALVGVVGTALARWTCAPNGALRLAR